MADHNDVEEALARARKLVEYRKFPGFIRGPVPKLWVQEMGRLGGKAGMVAWVLCYLAGVTKSRKVKLARKVLRDFYLNRMSVNRALRRMEEAGLIELTMQRGRAPWVTLLWEKDQSE